MCAFRHVRKCRKFVLYISKKEFHELITRRVYFIMTNYKSSDSRHLGTATCVPFFFPANLYKPRKR